jgi:hypothetical protein
VKIAETKAPNTVNQMDRSPRDLEGEINKAIIQEAVADPSKKIETSPSLQIDTHQQV